MMENKQDRIEKLTKARKRVENIKCFYTHLIMFFFGALLLLLGRGAILGFFVSRGMDDGDFLKWVGWNVYLIPVIWGMGLGIAALFLFGFKSMGIKNWEDRQLRKYMEEDDQNIQKYE